MTRLEVATERGVAWADVDEVDAPVGLLLLGHGAGGNVDAPDLLAARDAAVDRGFIVVRMTQPYRVAGRRGMPPHPTLEQPWLAVAACMNRQFPGLPQIFGGRSAGARVACRTAAAGGAVGVICLAYPVHPPGRPDTPPPRESSIAAGGAPSRLDELDAVRVPVLVVQGDRVAFGMPPRRRGRSVVVATGADHSLKRGLGDVRSAVAKFLAKVLP